MEPCFRGISFRWHLVSLGTLVNQQESVRLSFQPFAVQCLTCGSRLRVTDPAIVGTIAACPKCSSMVQIERPAGQVAVGRANVDSEAITEEAIASEGIAAEKSTASGFEGAETVEPNAAIASAVPPDWQSERTRRSRQIALVAALSLSGLLTSVLVFGWFVRSWRGNSAAAQAEVQSELSADPSQVDTADEPTQQPDVAAPVLEQPATEPSDPVPENPPDASASPENAPDAPAPPQIDSASPPAEAPESSDAPIPEDLIPSSPIEPAAQPETAAQPADDGRVQELLQKYSQFLPDAGSIEAPTLQAPPTRNEVQIEAAAEEGDDPLGPVKPNTLNLKADLAIELALDSDGYPLADLVLLVSQITGVPIQVDWVSLDLAGIDIEANVPVPKGWLSARELLNATASELGGEIRQEESLLVLTLTDATFDKTMASLTDLQDFAPSRNTARSVLNEFLGGDPQAQQLHLGETRQEQQLAGLAIESLRRMRGMGSKIDDPRLQRWAHSAESHAAGWPLVTAGDAIAQVDAPITFAGFLRRMARRNQAACVVNWYDANRRAAAPEHLVFPHSLADAASTLNQTLSPLDLQVRQVDDQHWWVGTEATYDRLPVVVWTAPLGETRDRFTQSINGIMQGASPDVFRITFDPESDRALLLLPRYIVRQLPKITPSIASK